MLRKQIFLDEVLKWWYLEKGSLYGNGNNVHIYGSFSYKGKFHVLEMVFKQNKQGYLSFYEDFFPSITLCTSLNVEKISIIINFNIKKKVANTITSVCNKLQIYWLKPAFLTPFNIAEKCLRNQFVCPSVCPCSTTVIILGLPCIWYMLLSFTVECLLLKLKYVPLWLVVFKSVLLHYG